MVAEGSSSSFVEAPNNQHPSTSQQPDPVKMDTENITQIMSSTQSTDVSHSGSVGQPSRSDSLKCNESHHDKNSVTSINKKEQDEESPSTAQLILPNGDVIKMQVFRETLGSAIILDARQLYSSKKVLMYDPGFNSTCACASAITYIDGDKGLCLYRGYPVPELTAHHDFLDVCHLLLFSELPSTTAKKLFERQIKDEMLLHNRLRDFINSFVPGAHPMSILASVISAFASFYADPMSVEHIHEISARELSCIRLIAKMPTVVAMAYKTLIGEPLVSPRADLTYAENFLHMMFSKPIEPYRVDPLHAKIIDTFLIIHADHEQNASTSTVRTAGSSLANPYACIATGITSLWGRQHGGANEAVIRMLETEVKTISNIPAFLDKVKSKEVRLMGFGHRVYKNYDPRARLMRELCYRLKDTQDGHDELFDLALQLEQAAMNDDYFVSRKLFPNVDYWSGLCMRALNIPVEMFTAMFALGRCVGWLAHWMEMVKEGQLKIARPRQLYLGERIRHVSERKASASYSNSRNASNERPSSSSSSGWDNFYAQYGGASDFHRIQAMLAKERIDLH